MINPSGSVRKKRVERLVAIGAVAGISLGSLPLIANVSQAVSPDQSVSAKGLQARSSVATKSENIVTIVGGKGSKVKAGTITMGKVSGVAVTSPSGSTKVSKLSGLSKAVKALGSSPRAVLTGTTASGSTVSVPVVLSRASAKGSTVTAKVVVKDAPIPEEITNALPGVRSVARASIDGSFASLALSAQKASSKTWMIAGGGKSGKVSSGTITMPTSPAGSGLQYGGNPVGLTWNRLENGASAWSQGAKPRVVVSGLTAKGKAMTFSATPSDFKYSPEGNLTVNASGISPSSAAKALSNAKSLAVVADISNPAETRSFAVITGDAFQAGTGARFAGSISAAVEPSVNNLGGVATSGDTVTGLLQWVAGACVQDLACTEIKKWAIGSASPNQDTSNVYVRAPKELEPTGAVLLAEIQDPLPPECMGNDKKGFYGYCFTGQGEGPAFGPILDRKYTHTPILDYTSDTSRVYEDGACMRSLEPPAKALLDLSGQDLAIINLACAGADLKTVSDKQGAALSTISALFDVKIVTNTMGGEPLLTSSVIDCVMDGLAQTGALSILNQSTYNAIPKVRNALNADPDKACTESSDWREGVTKDLDTLQKGYAGALGKLVKAAPGAKFLVTNYPTLLAHPQETIFVEGAGDNIDNGLGLAQNAELWAKADALYIANTLTPTVNDIIWKAAKAAGTQVMAVDQTELFNAREATTNQRLNSKRPYGGQAELSGTRGQGQANVRSFVNMIGSRGLCLSPDAKTTWLRHGGEQPTDGLCLKEWKEKGDKCLSIDPALCILTPPKLEEQRSEFVNNVLLGSGLPVFCPGSMVRNIRGSVISAADTTMAFNGQLTVKETRSGRPPTDSTGGPTSIAAGFRPASIYNEANPTCLGAPGETRTLLSNDAGVTVQAPGPEALKPNLAGQLAMAQCWSEVLKANKSQACVRSVGDNEFVNPEDAKVEVKYIGPNSCQTSPCRIISVKADTKAALFGIVTGQDKLCTNDTPVKREADGVEYKPTDCESQSSADPRGLDAWKAVYDTKVEFDKDIATPTSPQAIAFNDTKRMQ